MSRSKRIFISVSLVFFAGLVLLMFDISRKTSFPGAKKRQEIKAKAQKDSLSRQLPPKKSIQPK